MDRPTIISKGYSSESLSGASHVLTGANEKKAIYLFDQLKKKGKTEKDFPFWINLRGISLDNNLNFNLTDKSFYATAECLNWKNGTNFSEINNFGLPERGNTKSKRAIWTTDSGLSRCYLYWYSYLNSSNSDLSYSNDDGRVVLAKPRSG